MKTFKIVTQSINQHYFNIQRRKNRCGPMFYTHILRVRATDKIKAFKIANNRLKGLKYRVVSISIIKAA